ncbi:class C sortase [Aerococcus urinaeequi]|uniref:class C sortase n=1 Tax=Aerococcus urinaeequi TaxID=51665 RepID=UPI003AE2956B
MNKFKQFLTKRNIFFSIIFVLGIAIIIFPLVSQFQYHQASRVEIEQFEENISKIDTSEIKNRIELANAYNQALLENTNNGQDIEISDPYSDEEEADGLAEYARMLEVNEQIGTVKIPKISEEIPIYAGTTESALQKGAGHLEGTSLPVGGNNTHSVITAHRGLPSARLFTDLDKLEIGDKFYIQNLKETLAYEIDDITVIEPHEIDYLAIIPNKDYITLLTCTPYMINTHRLLVRGHQVHYEKGEIQKDQGINGLWKIIIFISIILLLLLIINMYKKNKI